jgi:chemotaxis protein methyltransferase CheR
VTYSRAEALGLVGAVPAVFRDLIHERLGLAYEPHQFDQIADRLAPLVLEKGATSFMDYYYLLKYSPDAGEWLKVMDALAVQETYFWREIDQLRAAVRYVVPELAAALRGRPLRIWSVPCATGEEPLTLAMLLTEAGWFDRAPVEILASDASPGGIARAERGWYGARAFRNLPEEMRDKYFVAQDGGWSVSPALRRRVSYDIVNLMDESQVARHATAPIVFCRNVFIYFSDASIRRALSVFEQWMPSPAYLCVGASESLLRRTTAFDLQEIGGSFMYVKNGDASHRSAAPPNVERAS